MKFSLWSKQSGLVKDTDLEFELQTEGNERGIKALVTKQGDHFYAEDALEGRLTITADEARTIYFALEQYKTQVLKDVAKIVSAETSSPADSSNENLMFLGEMLQKVSALLFALVEDHDEDTQRVVNAWLNI